MIVLLGLPHTHNILKFQDNLNLILYSLTQDSFFYIDTVLGFFRYLRKFFYDIYLVLSQK